MVPSESGNGIRQENMMNLEDIAAKYEMLASCTSGWWHDTARQIAELCWAVLEELEGEAQQAAWAIREIQALDVEFKQRQAVEKAAMRKEESHD